MGPTMSDSEKITALLKGFHSGDQQAANELMPIIYQELRKLAASRMKNEWAGHTLHPTALVHEVYLKLIKGAKVDWQSRAHFFAVAARQMRRILVDHARKARADKRRCAELVSTNSAGDPDPRHNTDILALDEALVRLQEINPRVVQVIELRYFSGLTEIETAHALELGISTVKRDFKFGRAWLAKQLLSTLRSDQGA